MESPNTLVGLINQMQHLENSIASIVFEMVLKLSSLTDANMFLLVENGEGRRFGGKRQLCDAYLQGALMSLGGETEVALNPEAQGLHLRYIDGAEPPSTHPYFENCGGGAGLESENQRGAKLKERSSSYYGGGGGAESLGRKRNYEDNNAGEFQPHLTKLARMSKSSDASIPPGGGMGGERPEDLSRAEFPIAKREVLDEDSEVVANNDDSTIDRQVEMSVMCFQGSANNESYDAGGGVPTWPRPDPIAFANNIEELDQYFAVSDKVLAVKSIPLEKLKGLDSQSQSFEYKLFTSTLYDISKLAARCSPSFDKKNPSSKAHFHNVFERVWAEFTFLELLAQLGVQPKNGFSMRNFVRATMQKTYGHILDKLLSNSMKPKEPILGVTGQ